MSKEWIKISSEGLINERFFTLLGGSTKRGQEDKIGFFGSGLKYSLAYLLRNDIDFHIFIGDKEIEFSTEPERISGNTFNTICVNGVRSDITTDFGPKWEAWMIVREFYANAIDEGNSEIELTNKIVTYPNRTSIFIQNDGEFSGIFENFNDFFSFERKELFNTFIDLKFREREGVRNINVRILEKEELSRLRVYRKGFLVYESSQDSIFDYDFSHCDINEERLAADTYDVKCDIATALINSPLFFKVSFDLTKGDTFESYSIRSGYFHEDCIDLSNIAFLTKGKNLVPSEFSAFFYDTPNQYIVPTRLLKILVSKYGCNSVMDGDADKVCRDPKEEELSGFKENEFLDAMEIVKKYIGGYFKEGSILYPIKLKKFNESSVKGTIKKIGEGEYELFISIDIKTKQQFVDVILEESIHALTGFGDKTRDFQNYVMKLLTTLIIEKYDR